MPIMEMHWVRRSSVLGKEEKLLRWMRQRGPWEKGAVVRRAKDERNSSGFSVTNCY